MKRPKGSAESRDGEPEIRIGVSQPTELKRARWPSGNPETEQRVIEQNESQPDKHNQERPAEPLNAPHGPLQRLLDLIPHTFSRARLQNAPSRATVKRIRRTQRSARAK